MGARARPADHRQRCADRAEGWPGRFRRPLLPRTGIQVAGTFGERGSAAVLTGPKDCRRVGIHSRKPSHFSYSSGYSDAMAAYPQARAVGQPVGSAIYFAVDFNAQLLEPIDEYFHGIAAGLAAASGGNANYSVGVYGSGAVCDEVKRNGLAQYCWLSNSIAWTNSIGYQDWNIRQSGRLPELSFNHDGDEARDEYGAFQVADNGVAASSYNAAVPHDLVAPQTPQDRQSLSPVVISSR